MRIARNLSVVAAAIAAFTNAAETGRLRGKHHIRMEEDVAFWTNFVRNTQAMSIPDGPTNGPVAPSTPATPSTRAPDTLSPTSSNTVTTSISSTSVSSSSSTAGGTPSGTVSPPVPSPTTPFPTSETQSPITPFPTVQTVTQRPITPFPTADDAAGTPATSSPTGGRTPITTSPTDPSPPAFICPSADFVGCTAPDPNNPVNECDVIGEPCVGGNPGEFCCEDGCPRNYCTAKPGPP
mmetsp:Transcript_29967/g.63075  ORF Transcript_29967/g.63075 Transcript_29967/m.63075 type:complete len:237 (+) Transcript_29967:163-873(+)|eukprot:CAMPEP_0171341390 /NCGR_PEP_ID=MMETSP0878-20121228/10159_1 /TAXON_ID=67004 /ORGANISM="Thalassiosira weissflogii, Strain CCMP1336" /LENGTH=236 /DNA_ID=CAMNT_0011843617 /DNA_START=106 /DNA_END=816 /DNA_ORIENTATION=+